MGKGKRNRDHWVTVEELDTPLSELFDGVEIKYTTRYIIRHLEQNLELEFKKLEVMEDKELNLYIEWLEELERHRLEIEDAKQNVEKVTKGRVILKADTYAYLIREMETFLGIKKEEIV